MNQKEKNIYLGLSVLLFILLFYHQGIGLNFGLLGLEIWGLNHFQLRKTSKTKSYWLFSTALWFTAVSQMWFNDDYTFFATWTALLAYGLYARYKKIHLLLYLPLIFLNYISFPFRVFIQKWLYRSKRKNWLVKSLAFVVFPGIIGGFFLMVYATGSKILTDFFANLNFNFDFLSFILVGLMGFFLFFNYWVVWIPKSFIRYNTELKDEFEILNKHKTLLPDSLISIDLQRMSGVITLILLNFILLIFVLIYNYEQFFLSASGAALSEDTHTRVNTIIFSIVLAMGIILFFFHAHFNFDPKAKLLKKLSFIWIGLNSLLVFSAFVKTLEYVQHFGLTAKRIGVLIFLMLCLIGMYYSALKIIHKKTNTYLIHQMARVFFMTFILCSGINFSWIITRYNISNKEEVDYQYLTTLPYNYHVLEKKANPNNTFVKGRLDWFSNHPVMEKKKSLLSQNLYFRTIPQ